VEVLTVGTSRLLFDKEVSDVFALCEAVRVSPVSIFTTTIVFLTPLGPGILLAPPRSAASPACGVAGDWGGPERAGGGLSMVVDGEEIDVLPDCIAGDAFTAA